MNNETRRHGGRRFWLVWLPVMLLVTFAAAAVLRWHGARGESALETRVERRPLEKEFLRRQWLEELEPLIKFEDPPLKKLEVPALPAIPLPAFRPTAESEGL